MAIPEKVIICAIVKNDEKYLYRSMQLCIETGKMFDNYKIIIYENNSTDNTKDILADYSTDPNVVIISEDIPYDVIKQRSSTWAYTKVTGSDHPCRIEQISNARNKVVNEFQKTEYSEYKYIIWIDIDVEHWSLDGIADSFNKRDEWDAVFANGLCGNKYYDIFAYRNLHENCFGGEIIGEHYCYINFCGKIDFNGCQELIPVVSAFGGIGIYKKHLYNDLKYDHLVTEDIKQHYTNLLSSPDFSDNLLQIISSPCSKFDGGFTTSYYKNNEKMNIYWKNNSGYDNVIVCEHVALNVSLFMRGYRLLINPKMTYFWTG